MLNYKHLKYYKSNNDFQLERSRVRPRIVGCCELSELFLGFLGVYDQLNWPIDQLPFFVGR